MQRSRVWIPDTISSPIKKNTDKMEQNLDMGAEALLNLKDVNTLGDFGTREQIEH